MLEPDPTKRTDFEGLSQYFIEKNKELRDVLLLTTNQLTLKDEETNNQIKQAQDEIRGLKKEKEKLRLYLVSLVVILISVLYYSSKNVIWSRGNDHFGVLHWQTEPNLKFDDHLYCCKENRSPEEVVSSKSPSKLKKLTLDYNGRVDIPKTFFDKLTAQYEIEELHIARIYSVNKTQIEILADYLNSPETIASVKSFTFVVGNNSGTNSQIWGILAGAMKGLENVQVVSMMFSKQISVKDAELFISNLQFLPNLQILQLTCENFPRQQSILLIETLPKMQTLKSVDLILPINQEENEIELIYQLSNLSASVNIELSLAGKKIDLGKKCGLV